VVVGLWLWFGQLLGLAAWLVRFVSTAIKRRLRYPFAWHGLLTLIAGGVAALFARKIFAGGGIRQTYVGSLGPWVVPLCVILTALVAPWIAARVIVDTSARRTRWGIACVAAVLAAVAVVLLWPVTWLVSAWWGVPEALVVLQARPVTAVPERAPKLSGSALSLVLTTFGAPPAANERD